MKTLQTMAAALLLGSLCMAAGCDDAEDTRFAYVNVPLDNHNVVLAEEDVFDVGIGIGSATYRVESDKPEIVSAQIVDGAIRLTAHAIGTAMVRLSDEGYNRARMQVEVRKLYELTLEALPAGQQVLRLDNDQTPRALKILTGNGGYEATSSDPAAVGIEIVADPEVEGGWKLVLTGKSNASDVTVTVTDAKRKSAEVKVRVTNPISPITVDVEGPLTGEYVYNGVSPAITFNITSGNGDYVITSSNEGVATASLNGTAVTVSVVGDGGTTFTIVDREKESKTLALWVPLNTDDPTPRIYWDGYRADAASQGVTIREGWATLKQMYWDQTTETGTDTYRMAFSGGWADGLECVKAANRKPALETTVGGVTTLYNDLTGNANQLASFKLVKQVNATPTPEANPRIYWITFKAADKEGFLVFGWKYN